MLKVQFPFNPEGFNSGTEKSQENNQSQQVEAQAEPPVQQEEPQVQPEQETEQVVEGEVAQKGLDETAPVDAPPPNRRETQESEPAKPNYLEWYNNEFGTSYESVDEIKQATLEKNKPAEPEPADPQLAAFKNFQKETGGGMEEFVQLSKNWSEVDTLTAVKNLIVEEHKPLTLKPKQIEALIEKKYGVDVSDGIEDLDEVDVMQMELDAEKYKLSKKAEYEKYFNTQPAQTPNKSAESESGDEVVVNGQQMSRREYDMLRQAYLTERQEALKQIKETAFGITVDENGEKKPMDFKYVYTDEDRAFASSLSEDISAIPEKFLKDGKFDHQDFNEGLIWMFPENRERLLKPLLEAAFAAGVDQTLKESRNVNFNPSRPAKPEPVKNGVDVDTIKRALGGGPTIKFSLNPKN